MFPFTGNFNPINGQVAPQNELCNLAVIQSMQDYLRYLILNVNVAEYKLPTPVEADTNTAPSSPGKLIETKTMETEPQPVPVTKKKVGAKLQKSSARLWNLMVKRYSTKKIKSAEKEIDPNEVTEEGEVYRKYHGVYVPIIKHQIIPTKKEITCGHPDREHYARGMCGTCYHKLGRDKKPWNCSHDKLYALGLCHKCYTARNRQIKKERRQAETADAKELLKSINWNIHEQKMVDLEIKQEF